MPGTCRVVGGAGEQEARFNDGTTGLPLYDMLVLPIRRIAVYAEHLAGTAARRVGSNGDRVEFADASGM